MFAKGKHTHTHMHACAHTHTRTQMLPIASAHHLWRFLTALCPWEAIPRMVIAGSSFPSLKRLSLSMWARGSLGLGSLGVPSTRAQRPTVLPQPTMLCRTHVCSCQIEQYEVRGWEGARCRAHGLHLPLASWGTTPCCVCPGGWLPAVWLHGGQCSLGAARPRPQSLPPRWRRWGPAVGRNITISLGGAWKTPNPIPSCNR